MEYEYQIYCACGSMSSGGGFTAQVNFTDAEVLGHTWHNGGCPIQADATKAVVSHTQSANITTYTIQAA